MSKKILKFYTVFCFGFAGGYFSFDQEMVLASFVAGTIASIFWSRK